MVPGVAVVSRTFASHLTAKANELESRGRSLGHLKKSEQVVKFQCSLVTPSAWQVLERR